MAETIKWEISIIPFQEIEITGVMIPQHGDEIVDSIWTHANSELEKFEQVRKLITCLLA